MRRSEKEVVQSFWLFGWMVGWLVDWLVGWLVGCLVVGSLIIWVWVKIEPQGTAGFSLLFHLPGFHFGYLFLTRSHLLVLGCAKSVTELPLKPFDHQGRGGRRRRLGGEGAEGLPALRRDGDAEPVRAAAHRLVVPGGRRF